jgi:hypothetical protein
MLPSLRLIAVTFVFGFAAAFAGLRIAAVTLIAQDSPPALLTPPTPAPIVLAHGLAARPVQAPVIAPIPALDPPPELVVPVMFNLDSVIAATEPVAEVAAVAPEITPPPAKLAPLTILPEIAWRSVPEATPEPAKLPPLTILPEMASRSEIETTSLSAEPVPLPAVPEIALQAAPEPLTAPDVNLAQSAPGVPPPGATIDARAQRHANVEATGAIDPAASSASAPTGVDGSNLVMESPPIAVWVRLPVAKPPPRSETKDNAKAPAKPKARTAHAKRSAPARRTAPPDPFQMIFANPRHKFDRPSTWTSGATKGRAAGIYVPNH